MRIAHPFETLQLMVALKDSYAETAELISENLAVIDTAYQDRPYGDAKHSFNLGLQLGAMLERIKGD